MEKKRRAGMLDNQFFCPFKFHAEYNRGEFEMKATNLATIEEVIYGDGHVEYIFWDEASLAMPAGFTLEDAKTSFRTYCTDYLGDPKPVDSYDWK
ncbi:hypothetical protein A73_257 [Escherichia phage A73]|uniref:Uncharacterized protein n=1 Tax=Escherichia phage A73 TaxID=3003819 RepID=A0AAF0AQK2_9CAUD|nr:hypothetical protein A73_257 [Escherichia phage A73]WBF77949.1 hypothetical protein W70_242 [Escherichia phage W70]